MRQKHNTEIEGLMEQIISNGAENMALMFVGLFDLTMRIEYKQYLVAGHDERVARRKSYTNGYKTKKIDTPALKTTGHLNDCREPFYPQSLEQRRRVLGAYYTLLEAETHRQALLESLLKHGMRGVQFGGLR